MFTTTEYMHGPSAKKTALITWSPKFQGLKGHISYSGKMMAFITIPLLKAIFLAGDF